MALKTKQEAEGHGHIGGRCKPTEALDKNLVVQKMTFFLDFLMAGSTKVKSLVHRDKCPFEYWSNACGQKCHSQAHCA